VSEGYTVHGGKIMLSPNAREWARVHFPHLEKHEAELEMAKFLRNLAVLRRAGIIQREGEN